MIGRAFKRWSAQWRRSLQFRLIALSLGVVLVMSLLLFFALERLVASHVSELHDERLRLLGEQFRVSLRQEGQRLRDLAALAAGDADLEHAVYYHPALQGERAHPQRALQNVAGRLRLAHLRLLDSASETLVAAVGAASTDAFSGELPLSSVHLFRGWDDEWFVTQAPIKREGQVIATLLVLQRLDDLYRQFAHSSGARVAVQWPPETDLLPIDPASGDAFGSPYLSIDLPNNTEQALRLAKRVLAITLLLTAVLLAGALAWLTQRELRPLVRLQAAAHAIGSGQLGEVVDEPGDAEVGSLVRAFNTMSRQLRENRERERHLQRQEQLAVIGNVAAQVAHDLNNPLTVITNTSRLLQRDKGADPARLGEDLELIHHHAQRCSAIVSELLQLGRPVRLNREPCNLSAWLAPAVARYARAQGAPERFVCEVPTGPVWVDVDIWQWERCLVNVLQNAMQAHPSGRVQVNLRAVESVARVCISDEGPGFEPASIGRLFEPFYTTKTGGTGLGLSVVQRIMQAHAGGIDIRPHESTVCLWLPAIEPPHAGAPALQRDAQMVTAGNRPRV